MGMISHNKKFASCQSTIDYFRPNFLHCKKFYSFVHLSICFLLFGNQFNILQKYWNFPKSNFLDVLPGIHIIYILWGAFYVNRNGKIILYVCVFLLLFSLPLRLVSQIVFFLFNKQSHRPETIICQLHFLLANSDKILQYFHYSMKLLCGKKYVVLIEVSVQGYQKYVILGYSSMSN